MPKRKYNDSDSDDYIRRKIKKLERKLLKRKRKRISSVSSEDSNPVVLLQEDNLLGASEECNDIIDDENIDYVVTTHEPSPTDSTLQVIEGNSDPIIFNIASTSADPSEPAISLDNNILEMLGENPSKNKKYSPPIQAELAIRCENIATTGLSKDVKKDLLEKYFIPENCLKVSAPKLNAEIKAALSDTLIKKDKVIETKQNQQAVAIACISQALTKIFASQPKDTEVIKFLIDGIRLLCDYQYTETMSGRSFVTSTIKKDIKDHLYTTEIDSFLFGEKLADTLKSAKAINKSGAEMKTVTQFKPANFSQPKFNQTRPLNGKPPLPLTRQTGVGRRPAPAMQQPRRYQAHPPSTLPAAGPQPPPLASQHRSRGRTQTRR